MVLVKRGHDRVLVNPEKHAVGDRAGGHHAKSPARHTFLAAETATVKNSKDRCLPMLGSDCQLHLPLLDVENGVSRFSLHEDVSLLPAFDDYSLRSKSLEEALQIKTLSGAFPWHGSLRKNAFELSRRDILYIGLTGVNWDFRLGPERQEHLKKAVHQPGWARW
jgi:hypothetical protein